jgi:hypothetical protein
VLAYLRPGREEFYGLVAVLRVAAALPDARVLVAGCERLEQPVPANVRCLGWVADMAAVYAGAHVLLRMAAHDGLAFMVQEALAYGRHAVWNHPFPGVRQALSAEEAVMHATELAEQHRAGRLSLNHEGADHVRRRYSERVVRDDLRRRLAEIAGRRDR